MPTFCLCGMCACLCFVCVYVRVCFYLVFIIIVHLFIIKKNKLKSLNKNLEILNFMSVLLWKESMKVCPP